MIYNGYTIYRRAQAIAEELASEIIELRRHFHQYPELSWQEYETAAHLTGILRVEEVRVTERVCETGLTAEIGETAGSVVAIRADMDALPLQDIKNVPYASKVAGVIHACGHDCHMAMAVGVAQILRRLQIDFPGKVKFIFQPCEESVPSGAHELVEAGVMDNVDAIFAFHVDPGIEFGKIGLRKGLLTAHCSEFHIKIEGKSGHAARPHLAVDTVFIANQVLNMLYDITGDREQPFIPAVLTIGKVNGGLKSNVIPDIVEISGTVRTIDKRSTDNILAAILQQSQGLVDVLGGRCNVEFPPPVPAVNNNETFVEMIRDTSERLGLRERLVNIEKVSMGGEDFSWFLSKSPGVLVRLGAHKRGEPVTHLHTSAFDIDERALPFGASLMTMFVLKYLLKDQLQFPS